VYFVGEFQIDLGSYRDRVALIPVTGVLRAPL